MLFASLPVVRLLGLNYKASDYFLSLDFSIDIAK